MAGRQRRPPRQILRRVERRGEAGCGEDAAAVRPSEARPLLRCDGASGEDQEREHGRHARNQTTPEPLVPEFDRLGLTRGIGLRAEPGHGCA